MLPVVDCDVHHTWKTEDEVLPYFPARWRELGVSGQI